MKLFTLASSLVLLVLLADMTLGNEVIGCGGFIKSASTEINYKIIKIKLITKDGVVKYTTEASPVNGYYMIPVYTKGDYLLQVNPPPGWSFEPSQVSISVDGQNDPCSKNEDINFFFKGFGLSGKIVTQGDPKSNGPSGVKLNLIANGKQIDSTQSGADGSYYFSNVMPGEYQVEAVESSMKFSKSKVNVVLSKENWFAKDNIVVSGFSIEGPVTTSNKTPVKDAIVELHFADAESSKNVDTKQFGCDSSSKSGSRVCQVKTDSTGKFVFSNLPFGKYKLVAKLETNNGLVTFHMEPNELVVDLTRHQNEVFKQAFVISSVSIKSKAVVSEKRALEAIKDTKVALNGNQIALNQDGSFLLSKLTTGKYSLTITSPHIYYEEKQIQIDLERLAHLYLNVETNEAKSLHQLTRVQAVAFDVCGQVKVSDPSLVKLIQIKCYDTKLVSSVNVDVKTFKYCLKLNANVAYTLKAELSDDSVARVLKLVPLERKLTLTDGPIFDINFEQLEAKLDGKLILLPGFKPGDDFKMTLKSTDAKRDWQQTLDVKCSESKDASNQTRMQCVFSLTNLLFGDYKLITSMDDLFCWSQNNGIISVNSEKQQVEIQQSGYKLNYKLSHNQVNLKLQDKTGKTTLMSKNVVSDSEMSGQVCVPQIDEYQIQIESCHLFGSGEENVVKIGRDVFKRNANQVDLVSTKHLLQVEVVFKYDEPADKSVLAEQNDIIVKVEGSDSVTVSELKFKLDESASSNNQLLFKSKTWLPASSKPYTLRASSSKVLFEKNEQTTVLNEVKCDQNIARFEAKLGIFITGRVTPANIDSIDLLLKQIDSTDRQKSTVLSKTSISSSGEFRLGPLKAPHSQYDIELHKSGFLFFKAKDVNVNRNVYKHEFSAEKLGQLKVSVLDRKQKTGLENVLLSLSSEDRSFRQTTKTDAQGQASFDNLKPSLYYLILMMQEYEFNPNSHPIQISDGRQVNLVVEADRIAYSCFGKVTTINGQPETSSDILVEATGVRSTTSDGTSDLSASMECQTSRENSPLDEHGSYRIRNLKPKCVYELTAVRRRRSDGNTLDETQPGSQLRIVPSTMQVTVAESDILNQNFVILTKSDRIDVSIAISYRKGQSSGEGCNLAPLDYKQVYNFARVRVFKSQQPDHIIQTLYTPANSIAYLNYLPRHSGSSSNQQYTVLVELLMPSAVTPYTSQLTQQQQLQLQQQPVLDRLEFTFDVDENTAYKHLKCEFKFDTKKSDAYSQDLRQQQYQNVYFTLPLFLFIITVVFNSAQIKKKWTLIQQNGGLAVYLQDLLKGKKEEPVGEIQSIYNLTKKSKVVVKQQASKDSDTETNRQRKQKTPTSSSSVPSTAPSTPLLISAAAKDLAGSTRTLDTQSDSQEESGESVEGDYTILKNPALSKRKVKKIN